MKNVMMAILNLLMDAQKIVKLKMGGIAHHFFLFHNVQENVGMDL